MFQQDYISMQELEQFDYNKFGTILKRAGLLPPSYDRKPASVVIGVSNANSPKVEITFQSTTSDSYRTIKIYSNDRGELVNLHEFVNGSNVCNMSDERYDAIVEIWKRFKDNTLWELNILKDREIEKQVKRAEKLLSIKYLKAAESRFIQRNRDRKFEEFHYTDVPCFSYPKYDGDGNYRGDEIVTPLSAKTLELCVLNLTKEAKLEEAKDIDLFREKCAVIAEQSACPNDRWGECVNMLSAYILSILEADRDKTIVEEDEL